MEEPAIEIRELRPGDLATFLDFFDNVAFVDNPKWAGCYCLFPHVYRRGSPWDIDDRDANRAATSSLIEGGEMRGYLAYADGRPVAWCSANLRDRYTIFDRAEGEAHPAGAIACFVVAPAFRRQGIARRLLDAACEGFREAGIEIVEANPRPETATPADNHPGPLSMYLAAGFEIVEERRSSTHVRKRLAPG